jgi:hypothetical protein
MPKKLFAVTNIKTGQAEDQFVAAGNEVDPKKLGLDKETLANLYDQGAIEIRTVDEEPVKEETPADVSSETEQTPNGGSQPPVE